MPNSILDSLPIGPLRRFDDFLVRATAAIGRPKVNTYRLVAKSDGLHVIKWDGTDVGPLAASGGGGGSAGTLLGVCAYQPGTGVDTTSTTSYVNLDATNGAVTFTAPASGNVLVRVTFQAYATATNTSGYAGILESGSLLHGCQIIGAGSGSVNQVMTVSRTFYITGVSAGSHTYTLAIKHVTASFHARYGGVDDTGALTIEVFAAP